MMTVTRRALLRLFTALAGVLAAAACSAMGNGGSSSTGGRMMGSATSADMASYMDLFDDHTRIRRTVHNVAGGVQTTTESDDPELAARLQAHVSAMYQHVDHSQEVTCMSSSLPTLFRNASGYRRQLTMTETGVRVTETSDDPRLIQAIRDHAGEVSGFVRNGMPAMMRGMMDGA